MSKKNVVLSQSAQDIVAQIKSLSGVRGIDVNIRSIWVDAPQSGKAAEALKKMGFKFAPSKAQWWLTPAEAPAQKVSTPVKAEPKQAQKPQAEKAQKAYEELPEAQKAQITQMLGRKYPGTQVLVVGSWVRVAGEKTRDYKDSLKADGFHWAPSESKQYWTRAIPQAWLTPAPAKTAPKAEKAEPKKAQPKARKTPVKGGVVSMSAVL